MNASYILVSTNETWLQEQLLGIIRSVSTETLTWQSLITSPDMLTIEESGSIGIDTVRELTTSLARKPYAHAYSIAVIRQAALLTPEAQNALLKLLEEPPATALLFLWTQTKTGLLPTILSRCFIIEDPVEPSTDLTEEETAPLRQFLQSSIGQRLQWIKKQRNDQASVHRFISTQLVYFHQLLDQQNNSIAVPKLKTVSAIKHLLRAEVLLTKHVSPRFVAEMLALTLPHVGDSVVR